MTKKMKKIKSEATIESPIMIVSGAKSTPGHKNIRKTSETQKDLMIEYFETHDGAIDVVSANNTDAEVKRRIWSEITEILNKVEGGTKKNDLKWAKTWADMKLYTKNRARAAKQGTVQGSARKPSDHDRRVLRVTGHEDLLQDWDTSLLEGDITGATTYEKIHVDNDTEHEIVVTEGTDYEYIEEEEMGENTQEIVRIQPYYETETQYEYSEPVQVFKVEPKRKRNEEDTEMIEMHEVEQQQTTSTPKKRQKTDTEDEEQTQDASFQEERRSNSSESMAAAINNLANALHSVASALTSFADAAKTFNR